MQRRRLGGGRGHDDRVFERAVILQGLDDLGDGRAFLADRDVNAVELGLFIGAGVDLPLIEHGVDGERGLAGLTVADDQLALAAPDRHQRIDRLQPGLHRLVHRAPRDDAGRLDLDPRPVHIGQRTLAVDRFAQRIDDPAEQAAPDRHIDDGAGALDGIAFADAAVVTEDDDADIVALEVERHAAHAIGKFDHLASLNLVEAIDPGNTVADRQYLADLRNICLAAEIGDLLL